MSDDERERYGRLLYEALDDQPGDPPLAASTHIKWDDCGPIAKRFIAAAGLVPLADIHDLLDDTQDGYEEANHPHDRPSRTDAREVLNRVRFHLDRRYEETTNE